jgi:hypothetical protein
VTDAQPGVEAKAPIQEGTEEGRTMTQRRLLVIIFVVLLLLAILACQSSTALMTDDQIMNHVVKATPWP